jgi:hypothetical protein
VKERAEGFAGGNARKEEGRRKVTVVGCTDLKAPHIYKLNCILDTLLYYMIV